MSTLTAEQAVSDRAALLSALGWKLTAMDDDDGRKMVIEDARLLRPEMAKARERADEAQSARDWDEMVRTEEQDDIAKALKIDVEAEAWWTLPRAAKHEKILARLAVVVGLRGAPALLP